VAWVTLGIGSNLDPVGHITGCLDELLLKFNDLSLSCVFESEAVGFEGDNFLNMVVGINTDLALGELSAVLKAIEEKQGRDRTQPKFSGRTLDIDILTYDDLAGEFNGIRLPRSEITENAFVLWPLSQVSGKQKHPVLKQSFAGLWEQYDKDRQNLWPVDFKWHGRMISTKA
jgi:2-amino-4-hydroxy-6-hydroxymethyldihydropteridine diphosphokinase